MKRIARLPKFTALLLIVATFTAMAVYFATHVVESATNILSASDSRYAWNDVVGWMDFYGTNTVTVGTSRLTGYASSSVGDISLDCATTRSGDICTTSNYYVANNGAGTLSGWGWNDVLGWISFSCTNTENGCSTSAYGVYINGSTGIFNNYAWSDVAGWISFNCSDSSSCATSTYRVVTSWRATSTTGYVESSIFDTSAQAGAQINSFLWRGSLPANTSVNFQFAASNSTSGPWTYIGTDGTSNTSYSPSPNVSTPVNYSFFNNLRYIRYKVTLVSDQGQTATPRVDDVIINWSP